MLSSGYKTRTTMFFLIDFSERIRKIVALKGVTWYQGVEHDVIKILNFNAIYCKFDSCLNNCIYRQRCKKNITN